MIRVLSGDPGTRNFALAVQEAKVVEGRLKIRIIGTAMIPDTHTLTDLKEETQDQLKRFRRIMIGLRKEYEPDFVLMERFQSRGMGGATIEHVNMMLGVAMLSFRGASCDILTAAMWKNRTHKFFDLKAAYRGYGLTSKAKAYTGIAEHELDAALIGLYQLHKAFDLPPFQMFEDNCLDDYIAALQRKADNRLTLEL